MIPDRLPWRGRQWERVERSIRAGKAPPALPLRRAGGNGKALFAARPAAALPCRSDDPPCGGCATGNVPLHASLSGSPSGSRAPGAGGRAAEVNDVALVLGRFALGTATGRSGRRAPAKR